MKFTTQIDIPSPSFRINHGHTLMIFGSCFSENIGNYITNSKFKVFVNPFGISYNPMSIVRALTSILENKSFSEKDLICKKGQYSHWMLHGSFSHANPLSVTESANKNLIKAIEYIHNVDYIFITFGTAFVYQLKETGEIVNNCHKMPAALFSRRMLRVEEIVDTYQHIISELFKRNKKAHIIFTISPIRHWKDGAHGNQLSKSTLLLATNHLQNIFSDRISYFPSYELILDELRDYRFYAEDMLHPNAQAIAYCWEKFCNTYFDKNTMEIIHQWSSIYKSLLHNPIHKESEEHKQFLTTLLSRVENFSQKHPNIDCCKEIYQIRQRILRQK